LEKIGQGNQDVSATRQHWGGDFRRMSLIEFQLLATSSMKGKDATRRHLATAAGNISWEFIVAQ